MIRTTRWKSLGRGQGWLAIALLLGLVGASAAAQGTEPPELTREGGQWHLTGEYTWYTD